MELLTILSLIGASLQLTAYGLMQLNYISSETFKFQIPNLIGSILLVIASLQEIELMVGFLILELVWMGFGFLAITRLITIEKIRITLRESNE